MFLRRLMKAEGVCSVFFIACVMICSSATAQVAERSDTTKARHENADVLHSASSNVSVDKDASLLLRRLTHVTVMQDPFRLFSQSFMVGGVPARYNQLLVNGAPVAPSDELFKSYALGVLPAEWLSSARVQLMPDVLQPADVIGGTVDIQTAAFPSRNFVYVLAGVGAFQKNTGNTTYLGDARSTGNYFGFAGSESRLPYDFPNTKSRLGINEFNLQQRIDFAGKMSNRLQPEGYTTAVPNNRFMFGIGRIYKLNKTDQLGIQLFVQQQRAERVDQVRVQSAPDISNNPYPFNSVLPLLGATATDSVYRFAAVLSAYSVLSYKSRQSTINWRNIFVNQLENRLTARTEVFKPQEDTAARFALHYLTERSLTISSQLDGEHLLNRTAGLSLQWRANYTYALLSEPDERNILLTQNPANGLEYRLALQSQASLGSEQLRFLNSSRSWRNATENNFNASVLLSFPFKATRFSHDFKGGFFFQNNHRVFYSDVFLLTNAEENNFFSIDRVLSAERYYPEGVTVQSFYSKIPSDQLQTSAFNARQSNLGNYTGSLSVGAAFFQVSSRLGKQVSVDWGLRLETSNQVVSNTQYEFEETLEQGRLYTLNLNSRVSHTHLLPSMKIAYQPATFLRVYAGYARSLNRPASRELANYVLNMPGLFMVNTGNPILEPSGVDQYHAGVVFPIKAQSNFAVRGFYKTLNNPIENVLENYVPGYLATTPVNMPKANVSGVQLALNLDFGSFIKHSFFSHLSLFASGTAANSNVAAGPVKGRGATYSRGFSGVPDFAWSAGISFTHPRYLNLSVVMQEMGDALYASGSGKRLSLANGNTVSAVPELRQAGQKQMDVQVSQKFFKSRLQLIAGVNNLLQPDYILYQDLNGNKGFDKPLVVSVGSNGAYYVSGTDNTLASMKTQRQYYVTVSFLFQ